MKEGLTGGMLNFLPNADLERIHFSSLSLLEDHGLFSESDMVLDLFAKGGAAVDRQARMIRLPRSLVEAALQSAPKSFVFYGREPRYDLNLRPGRSFFGMGGTSEPLYWDYELGRSRPPTKADMVACTRVGHALPHVDFVMALCSAGDVPGDVMFLHEYDAIFRNTTKPVLYTSPGRWFTSKFIEMAAAACGGEDQFRQRPCIMLFTQTVSPLKISRYSEGMLEAAEFGVPILCSPGPMMGATSPATLAGNLVLINAEALFSIVMAQLIKPGTPVVYGPHVAVMDMVTAQCTYGSAEQALGRTAVAQLGRFYDLPSFGLGGGVEAKLPDAEAAAQAMMGMLLNTLSGLTLTQCLGTLASGMYGAPEMAMICDEIVHMLRRVLGGITVSDETLAIEVIKQVGHSGNFMAEEHTARMFRKELFFPLLFRRQSIDQWLSDGARPIVAVAHERVEQILAKAGPVQLSPGADEALEQLLRSAVAEARTAEAAS
jgi:trimethylamine--corrinoid protein Co-methyltransferase